MNIIGIIPARMDSTRFPGKPLAKILGIPMVGHVYFRAKMSESLDEVYIATCDKDIAEYAKSIGAKVIMTKDTHKRASDRAAEAMLKIEKEIQKKIDIAVMIQGDEPMLVPKMINKAIVPLKDNPSVEVANLMAVIKTKEEWADPNTIKVVVDVNNYALYFSREAIPSNKNFKNKIKNIYKQVTIIPFRRDFLIKFNNLFPMPLETIESIDMLRILEHGFKVKMVLIDTDIETHSVDTVADLKIVTDLMGNDLLISKYNMPL